MNALELYKKCIAKFPAERQMDDFQTEVRTILLEYYEDVKGLDENNFENPEAKDATIIKVRSLIDMVNGAIESYYQGCANEAYNLVKNILHSPNDDMWNIANFKIEKGSLFYRGRINDNTIKDFMDMFHIPMVKREIIKTQRYSMPGYPCLYLGNSVYDCWEELNRPSFDEMMLSCFRTAIDFSVFDLRIPNHTAFQKSLLPKTLPRLVLVIACQFKTKYPDKPFKPEYIIPQLLMQLILSCNREKHKYDSSSYDLTWGILYTSSQLGKDFPYGTNRLENIAMPIIENDSRNLYCNYLASLFEISDPLCCRYEELKVSNCFSSCSMNKDVDNYDFSKFGLIEVRLKNLENYKQIHYINFDCPQNVVIPAEGGTIEMSIISNDNWGIKLSESNESKIN